LQDVRRSSRDVAADEICVHSFEVSGPEDAARQNAVSEARRKALDLVFDSL
jgi:hypothetical protein